MPPDGKLEASGSPLTSSFAAELRHRAAVSARHVERVVLFGRDAGHRLEPMREVRRPLLDGPVFQRAGHRVGSRGVERRAFGDGVAQCAIGRLGKTRLLHLIVEDERAEQVAHARRHRGLTAFRHRPVTDVPDGVAERCGSHVALTFLSCQNCSLGRCK